MGRSRHLSNTSATAKTPVTAPGEYPSRLPAHLENTLINPRFDQESCGVGFVAQLSGQPSREILNHALTALSRLEHRGAVAADGRSSDGVGVTTAISRNWLLAETGIKLPPSSPLGVAVVFLPADDAAQRQEIDTALAAQNCRILAWRPVPARPEVLGEIANAARPVIWHVLITSDVTADFDRRLFLARKLFEVSQLPGYVASISSRTMVYKAMCAGRLLADFYPELARHEIKTT